MAQNNEDAVKALKDLRAKIGLLTRCLNAKVSLPCKSIYQDRQETSLTDCAKDRKVGKKTPITVTSRLEELIEDLAAKKDSFEIKYLEAMSEKTKLEHKIQDLTILLRKHGISTGAARFILPAGSEVSDDESDH
jgi:transposase